MLELKDSYFESISSCENFVGWYKGAYPNVTHWDNTRWNQAIELLGLHKINSIEPEKQTRF